MEFRLLGPLEVLEHDHVLTVGGGKERALLGVLLLHSNEVVSTDRLLDELWGSSPPATAGKSIQLYVSRLRRVLGSTRLVTQAGGYALRLDPAELDITRFQQAVADANGADAPVGARRLREALALWRGPPLADFTYEAFAQAEIARLTELRLVALEARIDADLAMSRHAEVAAELEALVAAHPVRERFRAQLMLALYRAGRQADALDAYRSARRVLADELGLEPGPELRRLEDAILRQDPSLDLSAAPPRGPAAPPSPAPERSLLVVPDGLDGLDRLLALAEPLAASQPPRELIVAAVVDSGDLADTNRALAARGTELRDRGRATRTAAFSSPAPDEDIVRLATREQVDLLLMDAGPSPLTGRAAGILRHAPCDVAMLVAAGGPLADGAVLVPFGAAPHDWAALELGAWVARAAARPLRLLGAAADHREDGRDASRLLADASLIVQRQTGVVAEPLLARPGRVGIMALAEGAGLLVVGLSERWHEEGLGSLRTRLVAQPPAPTVLVRRAPRTTGMTSAEEATRFGWSVTVGAG